MKTKFFIVTMLLIFFSGFLYGNIVTYEYDNTGRLTKTIYKNSSGQEQKVISYTYDKNGNITKVAISSSSNSNSSSSGNSSNSGSSSSGSSISSGSTNTGSIHSKTKEKKDLAEIIKEDKEISSDELIKILGEEYEKTNEIKLDFKELNLDNMETDEKVVFDLKNDEVNFILENSELPENVILKSIKLKGEIKGKTNLRDILKKETSDIINELNKLPIIENSEIVDQVKFENVILKNVDFKLEDVNKIKFGEGVIFDKTTLQNFSKKLQEEISLVSSMPSINLNTENLDIEGCVNPYTPLLIENNDKFKNLLDIVKEASGLSQIKTENGFLTLNINGIEYKFTINDLKVSNYAGFSDADNLILLPDGGVEISGENGLKIVVYPQAYNIEELDNILSKYNFIEATIESEGTLKLKWHNEQCGIDIVSTFAFNANFEKNEFNNSPMEYKECKLLINYSDGVTESLVPQFLGKNTIFNYLTELNNEGIIRTWSYDRATGILLIESDNGIIRLLPTIYGTNSGNSDTLEVEESSEGTYIFCTPEGSQLIKLIK